MSNITSNVSSRGCSRVDRYRHPHFFHFIWYYKFDRFTNLKMPHETHLTTDQSTIKGQTYTYDKLNQSYYMRRGVHTIMSTIKTWKCGIGPSIQHWPLPWPDIHPTSAEKDRFLHMSTHTADHGAFISHSNYFHHTHGKTWETLFR